MTIGKMKKINKTANRPQNILAKLLSEGSHAGNCHCGGLTSLEELEEKGCRFSLHGTFIIGSKNPYEIFLEI